jgi:tetratricopeptide (TPR) repeat protein
VTGGDRTVSERAREARASFEAGDYRRCRETALAGLAERPDEPALLRLAGIASLELDLDDAAAYLERAVALDAGDGEAWLALGEALAGQGTLEAARAAFERAVELRPDDIAALVGLGHASYAAGKTDEGVGYLLRAVERDPANVGALRGLLEMYRSAGRREEALGMARRVAEQRPQDALAVVDVAELCLEVGLLDEASAAFGGLLELDDEPEHEVYAYHGMIEVEVRRERWRRALDLAVDCTRVDRLGRTTDVLAFVVAQVFGDGDRPAPSRSEIDQALARSRAEHRWRHAEALG